MLHCDPSYRCSLTKKRTSLITILDLLISRLFNCLRFKSKNESMVPTSKTNFIESWVRLLCHTHFPKKCEKPNHFCQRYKIVTNGDLLNHKILFLLYVLYQNILTETLWKYAWTRYSSIKTFNSMYSAGLRILEPPKSQKLHHIVKFALY